MSSPADDSLGAFLRAGLEAMPRHLQPGPPLKRISNLLFGLGIVSLVLGAALLGRSPAGWAAPIAFALLAAVLLTALVLGLRDAYARAVGERHAMKRALDRHLHAPPAMLEEVRHEFLAISTEFQLLRLQWHEAVHGLGAWAFEDLTQSLQRRYARRREYMDIALRRSHATNYHFDVVAQLETRLDVFLDVRDDPAAQGCVLPALKEDAEQLVQLLQDLNAAWIHPRYAVGRANEYWSG